MHQCFLLDFLCKLYYDAWIHEHQVLLLISVDFMYLPHLVPLDVHARGAAISAEYSNSVESYL